MIWKNGSFLTEFPTVFVASSARCEEKSSYSGHVKIHRSIPESFLFFLKTGSMKALMNNRQHCGGKNIFPLPG